MNDSYQELQTKVANLARTPKGGKQSASQAYTRAARVVDFLKSNGFSDFIVAAGLYYDGTVFARVTYTALDPANADSWRVSAGIVMTPSGNDAYRKNFNKTLQEWEDDHAV